MKPQIILRYDANKKNQTISFRLTDTSTRVFKSVTKYQIFSKLSIEQKSVLEYAEAIQRLYRRDVPFKDVVKNRSEVKSLNQNSALSMEFQTMLLIFKDKHPLTVID